MRIAKRATLAIDWQKLRRELTVLVNPPEHAGPVCVPDCDKYTPQRCNRQCPDAAQMLSSEDDYPLEPKITPLVFELKRLGAYVPCWSCEGHNDSSGKLWKLPQVWFYSDSIAQVRVLAEALAELYMKDRLNVRWGIEITPLGAENPDTSFSVQPELADRDVSLYDLHEDLEVIAAHLRLTICASASSLFETVRHNDGNKNNAAGSGANVSGGLFSLLRSART